MKTTIQTFIIVLAAISVNSCTKVIDIDIEEADREITVEMIGKNIEDESYLLLSKSSLTYESNSLNTVSNADVKVTELDGTIHVFSEVSPGKYISSDFLVKPNDYYNLTIIADSDTLTSNAETFSIPKIKAITSSPQANGQSEEFLVSMTFSDPVLETNFYRAKIWVNDDIGFKYYLTNDKAFNGQDFTLTFLRDRAKAGDTIKIELISMDEANFDFFQSLSNSGEGGGPFSAAPANLLTNITNGIGYFGMYTTDTSTYIVPQ